MAIDTYNLQRTKELILAFIKARGPSLPVHIARDVKTSPLFASAFLSELYNEQKLRMSHMKVGSTSLYLLPGQESQLENFIHYLNHKEQEAVALLKNNTLLEDDKIPPAIRVALRELKDFAIPSKQTINGQEKIVWNYAYASNNIPINITSANSVSQISIQSPPSAQSSNEIKPITPENIEPPKSDTLEQIKEHKLKIKKASKPKIQHSFSLSEQKSPLLENAETPFSKAVKEHFKDRNLEILAVELEKRKEFSAVIRAKTSFSHQDYYCISKDKKRLQETDIQTALQKAQEKRMPVLIMIPGTPDKKTQALLQHWGNLVKFEKLG